VVSGHFDIELGDEKSLFNQAAVADLTADMLLRGSGKLSREDITTRLDALKTKLNISGNGQTLSVQFQSSREHLPEVLKLMRDVLRAPSFPQTEFEQLRSQNLTAIEGSRNEPQSVGSRLVEQEFNQFKKGDIRYAETVDGLIDQYKAATLADLKRFHATMYGSNNGKFSLVGDFDAKQVQEQVKDLFGEWNSSVQFARLSNPPPAAKGLARQVETADKANAFYLAGLPLALQDNAPDYAAVMLANKVLGGGVESRLMTRLRQKEGISYGTGSYMSASAFEPTARMGMYAMYAPQNLVKVKLGIKEEIERFVQDGVTAAELDNAKEALLLERQTKRAQDGGLAWDHVHNLKVGRTFARAAELDAQIGALTQDQVNAAIKKYVDPAKFLHVYAGDFAGAAKKAAAGDATLAPAQAAK
jgi:zinc protease